MNPLPLLKECFEADRVYYTRHARLEMETDEFGVIHDQEVYEAVVAGEIIREYPDDTPYPSALVLGVTQNGRPLHVVCAYDNAERRAFVVTVYQPDPLKWADYRIRRTS